MSHHRKARRQPKKRPLLRRRHRRIAVLIAVAMAVATAIASAFFIIPRSEEQAGLRAAIVDQLSLTFPNTAFVEAATDTLEGVGYTVDYYPGDEVTVDFYRSLPTHGYDLLILRVHSARVKESREGALTEEVALFTGEPYSETKYVEDQWAKRVDVARYHEAQGDETFYFGIGPEFVSSSMRGNFDGAAVLLMGCDGLSSEQTAEAFIEKGAEVVVSWDKAVSASHTDAATEDLLQHLVVEGLTMGEAVERTMTEVGADPSYGSVLLVYPAEAEGWIIR